MSHLEVNYEKFIIDFNKYLDKKKPKALEFVMSWLAKHKIKANPWDTVTMARKLDKKLHDRLNAK